MLEVGGTLSVALEPWPAGVCRGSVRTAAERRSARFIVATEPKNLSQVWSRSTAPRMSLSRHFPMLVCTDNRLWLILPKTCKSSLGNTGSHGSHRGSLYSCSWPHQRSHRRQPVGV